MRTPVVDFSRCTMCMSCVEVCPEVFQLNHAGHIKVRDLKDYPTDCIEEAIKYCPEDVIEWMDI